MSCLVMPDNRETRARGNQTDSGKIETGLPYVREWLLPSGMTGVNLVALQCRFFSPASGSAMYKAFFLKIFISRIGYDFPLDAFPLVAGPHYLKPASLARSSSNLA